MNNHDILESLLKERELLSKISPRADEVLGDINEIMQNAENPKVMALLMYRMIQEKQKTNTLLESINEKYDKIMLSLKSPETNNTHVGNGNSNKFEVMPEPDQAILKLIEERGGCSANDIKVMMNYRGLNAACQRLNKLYKEGYLKKIQSGRKVLYLAKS